MHAAGGALVAGLGGGNALGGALGAGLTSKLGRVLDDVSDDIRKKHPTGNADMDEALGQIVATGLGTAVGAVAGGSSGAFTGFNTDRFNRQLHPDENQWIKNNASRYAKQLGITDEQALSRLTDQANRQVQSGSEGAWDQSASTFLSQARGMLPASGDSGLSYMFVATPGQKANPQMYAEFYVNGNGNGMNTPSASAILSAVDRETAIRNNLANATLIAAGTAATIATGGAAAAIPRTPIFSSGGALGSGTLAGRFGTGIITGGINAGTQYLQTGSVNFVDSAVAVATGAIAANGGLVRVVITNAAGGGIGAELKNHIYANNDSSFQAVLFNGIYAGIGFWISQVGTSAFIKINKPTINNSHKWIQTGTFKPSDWNLFGENNTSVIFGTVIGGFSQEISETINNTTNSPNKNNK